MFQFSPTRGLAKLFRKVPLRAVLIVPFVLQIIFVVGLTGYLSHLNGQDAVRDLVGQLEQQVGDRVVQKLGDYLKAPQLVTQINADAVRLGFLDLEDIPTLERHFQSQFWQFNDLQNSLRYGEERQAEPSTCPSPPPSKLTYIALASETGNYIDLGYNPSGNLETTILDRRRDNITRIWQVNPWGRRTNFLDTVPDYNPRNRPWYQRAAQTGAMVWVDPYLLLPYNDWIISVDRPIYSQQGDLIGVADATLSLSGVSEFLRHLKVGNTGQVFILQPNGKKPDGSIAKDAKGNPIAQLIGSSKNESLCQPASQDLDVLQSKDPLTRATALHLQKIFGSFSSINSTNSRQIPDLWMGSNRRFVRTFPFPGELRSEFQGLNWLVVVVVPQEDFMAQINENTQNTALLCLLALGVAIAIGTSINRWITRSIRQLSHAAKALAQGDWDRQVLIHTPKELGTLSDAFNHMRHQLRQSHQQLEQYSQGLEQKNEQLETLEAELRRQLNLFLHAVSHDLRNPVIGTSLVLSNLKNQPGDDLKLPRRVLDRMAESNQHQLDLINSLIDTHAAEIWGISLQIQPVRLSEVVRGAIADLQPILDKEQANLDDRISADLPLIDADALQISRVYQNLIANALKHNPSGLSLTLAAHLEGDRLRCTVTDNGVGIHPNQCDKLFDPYFRGEQKPKSVGLGLGLYLCQQIIQAHDGEIGVESQLGEGTTFWFTLPLNKVTD
ncbi:MAG: HAMP domain-containing protein [Drouetiella hepatica Uher 2000/2452]|jgi:signal transduction histidine kinase|uniref:histidine kinase n=1 Tax=Drouetiella hepatica Uher 2000/2452 TaxID=904376 RepID=A0A951QHN5_9CYAN|nr:HAMP domain-containing protein [Drouetiella hepatica Uher 2000/2452]